MFYSKLNALRGAAAFFVASFHYVEPYGRINALFYNSAIFVDLFFVLSGFVICTGYLQKISDQDINFRQFAFLRLMRLYPVHFAIMLAWLVFVVAKLLAANLYGIGSPQDDRDLFWSFFETLFLVNAYGLSDLFNWNFPTWTVSAELFAYLVFFCLIFAFRRIFASPGLLLVVALFISVSGYTVLYAVGLSQEHPELVYRHFDFGFLRGTAGFFAGVALSQIDPGRWIKNRGLLTDSFLEILLVTAVLWLVSVSNDSFVLQALMIPAFAAAIGFFSGQSNGVVSMFLNGRVMQHFGRISYSFYLWHVLILLFVTDVFQFVLGAETNAKGYIAGDAKWLVAGVAFASTWLFATFSYLLVEKPFRCWSRHLVSDGWGASRATRKLDRDLVSGQF
ncbi:MAG: acyltransferase [Roseibium sp.]|uniref:acyltransferase family protein n=1 Tax=Roseibium sp. TaxID=1936156 RepID=UPI001B09087F|nr:acyltransferase [Roseibium sp.]MBO6894554.1 acyltransferase [Roseibium sp.]MBO6929492.1 acyltransferase [Roseibium sp.]